MLQGELFRGGAIDCQVLDHMCAVFEGAYNQAKSSKRRPQTPEQQLFTLQELEWFSKNSYNLSLKHCAALPPQNLARLLKVCTEVNTILHQSEDLLIVDVVYQAAKRATARGCCFDYRRRLTACFLRVSCCVHVHHISPGRRQERNTCESYHSQSLEVLLTIQLQYYLEVRKYCQEFRRVVVEGADQLSGPAQDDILSKQLQVVMLEIEAALKLKRWDDLEELFEQCWNCKCSDRYETLADLVLVAHSALVQAELAGSYQSSKCAIQP